MNYNIIKTLAKLENKNGGRTRELNLVNWNTANPVFDIREWADNHKRYSRGIALSWAEMGAIYNAIKGYFKDEHPDTNIERSNIYDKLCAVLTAYETGSATPESLYNMLCDIQNAWEDVITGGEED